jgi:hypothetical protein
VDANFVNFFFFQPITIWFKIIWLQIYYWHSNSIFKKN